MKIKWSAIPLLAGFTVIMAAFSQARAADANPYANTLLGDVAGERSALAAKGIDIDLNYKGDFWSVVNGGAKRASSFVGAATLETNIDNNTLLGILGNSLNLQIINVHGGNPNSHVGSTQGVDNYEVIVPATLIYEAWMQQNFLNDSVSVLVGLRDLNNDFMVTDVTGNFLAPMMQLSQELAQTGRNGPATYPYTTLGARIAVKPTENTYINAALFDGVGGSLNHPNGMHANINNKDGLLLIAEVGFTPGNEADVPLNNKFAIGAWSYTKQFADWVDVDAAGDPILRKSQGIYALASHQFYRDQFERTLIGFLRVGGANGDVSQVEWAYEAGMVGHVWGSGHAVGEIGLGVAQANNSDCYIAATGEGTLRAETSFELYYRDSVAPGVILQPDLQYIINPGTTDTRSNATLFGLRVDLNF